MREKILCHGCCVTTYNAWGCKSPRELLHVRYVGLSQFISHLCPRRQRCVFLLRVQRKGYTHLPNKIRIFLNLLMYVSTYITFIWNREAETDLESGVEVEKSRKIQISSVRVVSRNQRKSNINLKREISVRKNQIPKWESTVGVVVVLTRTGYMLTAVWATPRQTSLRASGHLPLGIASPHVFENKGGSKSESRDGLEEGKNFPTLYCKKINLKQYFPTLISFYAYPLLFVQLLMNFFLHKQ